MHYDSRDGERRTEMVPSLPLRVKLHGVAYPNPVLRRVERQVRDHVISDNNTHNVPLVRIRTSVEDALTYEHNTSTEKPGGEYAMQVFAIVE